MYEIFVCVPIILYVTYPKIFNFSIENCYWKKLKIATEFYYAVIKGKAEHSRFPSVATIDSILQSLPFISTVLPIGGILQNHH